jgi:uncharacterized protein YaaQ
MSEAKNKLILAIMRKDDYNDTVAKLNENGIFVTKLASSGGFLKKENVTAMIGVPEDKFGIAMDILKEYAGKHRETQYTMPAGMEAFPDNGIDMALPVDMEVGGVTIFTMTLDSIDKF